MNRTTEEQAITTEHLEKVLRAMIRRKPFKPFTVQMHGGQRFEIDHPEATVMWEGVAIFIAPGFVPIYFDHEGVVDFIDAPAHAAPRRENSSSPE